FSTGRLDVSRVVALGGPAVRRPRLLATRIGAGLDEIAADELDGDDLRVISGSVLSGRTAMGEMLGYLGRYHLQVSALKEGRKRELFGWALPGSDRFSVVRVFLSAFMPGRLFDMTTTTGGSERAIVPVGMYERVMPLDIQPTYLLRSLVARDVERAEQLGALELEEEDLALCSFVCPGKGDYGLILRENLDILEKEG
ncbi:MAG TPA: NADH:ubiquinone reductase (Na(+)-transporting) subunit A, partial [Phycisphaerae bacterium]|nr:NADH:ubiquinone reductase (Na(+)-transporting) subunit A [Phycisphaerae bacterium]